MGNTFLNERPFDIRNAVENWLNKMNNLEDNTGLPNVADYTATLTVRQLGRDNQVLKNIHTCKLYANSCCTN